MLDDGVEVVRARRTRARRDAVVGGSASSPNRAEHPPDLDDRRTAVPSAQQLHALLARICSDAPAAGRRRTDAHCALPPPDRAAPGARGRVSRVITTLPARAVRTAAGGRGGASGRDRTVRGSPASSPGARRRDRISPGSRRGRGAARPSAWRRTICLTGLPFWKTIIVGIGHDLVVSRMASGLRSMSSLATVSLSLFSPAISSRTGATILQGPHHSAQKSTSTVLSLCEDVVAEGGVGDVHGVLGHARSPVRDERGRGSADCGRDLRPRRCPSRRRRARAPPDPRRATARRRWRRRSRSRRP